MTQNTVLTIAISGLSALVIGAFMAITLVYEGDKTVALAGLTALALMAFGQLAGLKVSADNSAGIKEVTTKTDNLATAVDGRLTLLIDTLKEQSATQQRLAAAQGLAHGITIGRGQVGGEIADPIASPIEPPIEPLAGPGTHQ